MIMVEFTHYSRSHAFAMETKIQKILTLSKFELTTSALLFISDLRGYYHCTSYTVVVPIQSSDERHAVEDISNEFLGRNE